MIPPPAATAATARPSAPRLLDPGPRPAFPGPVAMVSDIRQARAALKRMPMPEGRQRPQPEAHLAGPPRRAQPAARGYYKYGPVFGMRILHDREVFMIGPEANHFVLVSGRENFVWRHGRFGDLITLLGDGLLTTDGDYHDTSRAIMMPAFHRERVARAAETMSAEAERGDRRARRRRGDRRLPLDPGPGDADRDAGAVRLRPGLGPGDTRRRPSSSAASPSTARSSSCRCMVGPGTAVRAAEAAPGPSSSGWSEPRSGARRQARATTGATSSARCSAPPTTRAAR